MLQIKVIQSKFSRICHIFSNFNVSPTTMHQSNKFIDLFIACTVMQYQLDSIASKIFVNRLDSFRIQMFKDVLAFYYNSEVLCHSKTINIPYEFHDRVSRKLHFKSSERAVREILASNFSKIFGGACPRTPLVACAFGACSTMPVLLAHIKFKHPRTPI